MIYERVYKMDGRGLSDYLNDWITNNEFELDDGSYIELKVSCTRYGEKVFVQGDYYAFGTEDIFNRWDLWRAEVAYYFDGFMENFESDDEEELIEVFVWKICTTLGIIEDLDYYVTLKSPERVDEIFFM
jgi:hypothetical protein